MSEDFKVGDLVWAKVKGFPYWPARVANKAVEKELKEFRREEGIAVLFFGTELTYDLVPISRLERFSLVSPHATYKGDSSNRKDFMEAMRKIEKEDTIPDPPLELDEHERALKEAMFHSVSSSLESENKENTEEKNLEKTKEVAENKETKQVEEQPKIIDSKVEENQKIEEKLKENVEKKEEVEKIKNKEEPKVEEKAVEEAPKAEEKQNVVETAADAILNGNEDLNQEAKKQKLNNEESVAIPGVETEQPSTVETSKDIKEEVTSN